MKINDAGVALIKDFEKCRLEVYADAVGLRTVGWGHRTTLPLGSPISQPEADTTLLEDLAKFEEGVTDLIKVQVNSNQFSALVCFAFNVGLGNLQSSLLLRCINKGNPADAAMQFERWTHAGGRIIPGLVRRREAERQLFLK